MKPSHPDYLNLEQALESMEKIAAKINSSKYSADKSEEGLKLLDQISNIPKDVYFISSILQRSHFQRLKL